MKFLPGEGGGIPRRMGITVLDEQMVVDMPKC